MLSILVYSFFLIAACVVASRFWWIRQRRPLVRELEARQARLSVFDGVLQQLPEGLLLQDLTGVPLTWNARAAELLGSAPLSGTAWGSLKAIKLDGTTCALGEELARRARATETAPMVVGVERGDRTRWLSIQSALLLNAGKKEPQAVVTTLVEVTARIEEEQRNCRETERLRALLDSLDDGIWSIEAKQWTPLYLSRGMEALYGRPASEFTRFPRVRLDAVHADDRPLVEESWSELHKVGARSLQYRIVRPDGTIRWVEERCRMTFTGDGEAERIEGITTDITERQAAQAAITRATAVALESARMKSEFLANMSHEIRTPLNGILGMSDLALATPLSPEQREYVSTVRSSGESLLLTLNNLLDFSILEAGRLELDEVPFRVTELVAEVLRSVAPRSHQKGLELLAEIDPKLPRDRMGDPERVRQILLHLLGNAIKFTDEGEVNLVVGAQSTAEGEVAIHFTVSDTGVGIPPEQMSRIFDAFVQGDGSNTRRFGGNGLGLAIASELVQLMGGHIWVESEPGRGSSFQFVIPLAIVEGEARREPDEILSSLQGKSAFILDDHAGARRQLSRMLAKLGLKPHSTDNVETALSSLKQAQEAGAPFDFVFIDSTLPDADGFEVARRVRSLPHVEQPEIILLISPGLRGETRRAQEPGILLGLSKPILFEELVADLSLALKQKAARGSKVGHRSDSGALNAGALLAESRGRVLLAEDNLVNQKLAVRLLERRGFQVTVVDNGKLAVQTQTTDPHDLILMDLQMPVMDGFEATAEIRREEAGIGRHTPIIALTAHAMKGDRERCLLAGMDDYVTKPIQPAALFGAMDGVLAVRHASTLSPQSSIEAFPSGVASEVASPAVSDPSAQASIADVTSPDAQEAA